MAIGTPALASTGGGGGGGGDASAANQALEIAQLELIEANTDGLEGVLTTIDADTGNIASSVASIDTKTPALGQALAAGSVPIVLTAAQLTTLTPPAAITGFATSAKQDTLLTELQAKADLTETQPVSLATVPSHAVTNAGTFAVQVDGAALTSLQLIDDAVSTLGTTTYTETSTKGITIGAVRRDADTTLVDTTNEIGPLQMNAAGQLKVEVFSGEALPVTLTSTSVTGTVTANAGTDLNTSALLTTSAHDGAFGTAGTADAQVRSIQGIASMTPVQVSQATASNLNMTEASAADILTAVQTIDNAISGAGFNITQFAGVNNVTGSGTATGALRVELPTNGTGVIATVGTVTTVSTVTSLTGGGIAHDSADSGNPVKVGYKAFSPDGTTPGTAVAENDRTDAKGDLDGRLFVNTVHPRFGHKHLDGSTAYTDESIVADPGDGFQVVITSITVSTGSATAMNFFLEEGASKIFGPIYLEAVAGRGYAKSMHLPVTASTAVTLTTSASIAQSIDIDYFIQAV